MLRDTSVNTPENVAITYEYAGVGSRATAAIVDHLLQGLIVLILLLAGWGTSIVGDRNFLDDPSNWVIAVLIILMFVTFWGYFFFFEAFRGGQTPGKKMAGIRVTRDGGLPLDVGAAALRNLVRLVDMMPSSYMIGIVSMFISPHYKRLGDYAAGTICIKERVGPAPKLEAIPPIAETGYPEGELIHDVSMITPDDYQTIKRFCERAAELEPAVREQLACRIARPLIEKMGVTPERLSGFRYPVFLLELRARCQRDRGYL